MIPCSMILLPSTSIDFLCDRGCPLSTYTYTQIHAAVGRARSHHYRIDRGYHQGLAKAQREPALHHPADSGRHQPFLRATDGETGGSHGAAAHWSGTVKTRPCSLLWTAVCDFTRSSGNRHTPSPVWEDLSRFSKNLRVRKSKVGKIKMPYLPAVRRGTCGR